MKTLTLLIASFFVSTAFAWEVDCGGRSIYYPNGNTAVSSGGSFYYPNGNTLISTSGSMYFQNGNTFKSSSDSIYYANGNTLKSNSGSYYYQNGNTARSTSGTIYSENGNVSNIPFQISVDLSAEVKAVVNVSANSNSDSDIEVAMPVGTQFLRLQINASGVTCRGLANQPEITVSGRAGTATVRVKPGFDARKVQDVIQQALDSL